MIRILLFTVVALSLGIAGGVAARLPALKAERAELAAADSAASSSASATSQPIGEPAAGTQTQPQPQAQVASYTPEATGLMAQPQQVALDPAGSGGAGAAMAMPGAVDPATGTSPVDSEPAAPVPAYSEEGANKLAEIFAAMDASAAAAVLEGLDPIEIRFILPRIDSSIAAEILSAMSPDLAASLSRVVLNNGGGLR